MLKTEGKKFHHQFILVDAFYFHFPSLHFVVIKFYDNDINGNRIENYFIFAWHIYEQISLFPRFILFSFIYCVFLNLKQHSKHNIKWKCCGKEQEGKSSLWNDRYYLATILTLLNEYNFDKLQKNISQRVHKMKMIMKNSWRGGKSKIIKWNLWRPNISCCQPRRNVLNNYSKTNLNSR
jgi:hypothetical protein